MKNEPEDHHGSSHDSLKKLARHERANWKHTHALVRSLWMDKLLDHFEHTKPLASMINNT